MARSRTVDELEARATRNGYQRGAHKEEDNKRRRGKHVEGTIKDHDRMLRLYIQWHLIEWRKDCAAAGLPTPTEEEAHAIYLRKDIEAPDLGTIKDFFRFYSTISTPNNPTGLPTTDSINSNAERFFAGFERVTETEISEEDRSKVYHWVRKILYREGLVSNYKKPKYVF